MDEQDMNTETGRPRDVFAEVAEIAVGAAFADTAARRLAAGDIAHALGAAYPELAVGARGRWAVIIEHGAAACSADAAAKAGKEAR